MEPPILPRHPLVTDEFRDMDRLVTGFVKQARRYADLDFAGRGGTLELRQHRRSVIGVRLELWAVESLRLASVVVDAEGLTDLSQQARVTASSIIGPYRQVWHQRLVFDPANTATAVHTKKQQRPWLEIAFDHPVDVTRIFVRNVDDVDSARARGIQVLTCDADRGWTTIYDGLRRERAFARAVEQRQARWIARRSSSGSTGRRSGREPSSGHADTPTRALPGQTIADLARILTQIHLRDDESIRKDLSSLDLSADDKAAFKDRVNRWLAGQQREWNTHGISRTFRFWSEQEKQDYVGFAADVARSLRDLTDNVCFGFGSVLAVVRDHDLIPHDDDADVIVGFEPGQAPTLADGRRLIRECLADHGYTVTAKNRFAHHFVWRPTGGQKLDAFAGIFEGDDIAWYPGRRAALTRDMVFPPTYQTLLGHPCPVPRQPEMYLERIYGPNWQLPERYFRHRWEEARREYQDIRDHTAADPAVSTIEATD